MEKSTPESEKVPITPESLVRIGQLIIGFTNTTRLIDRLDGRFENDAEHSYMLAFIAREIIPSFYPHLSLAKITEYALVHDLPEIYAGDTPTFYMTPELQKQKSQREQEAFKRQRKELGSTSPNMQALERYELQTDPESRVVKLLDKIMPTIMHILNNCHTLIHRLEVRSVEQYMIAINEQSERLKDYLNEFPEIAQLRQELIHETCKTLQANITTPLG